MKRILLFLAIVLLVSMNVFAEDPEVIEETSAAEAVPETETVTGEVAVETEAVTEDARKSHWSLPEAEPRALRISRS